MNIDEHELQRRLALAWDQGHSAGWADFYRDDKAFREDERVPELMPNPYRNPVGVTDTTTKDEQ